MTAQRPLSVLLATLALTSWAGVCTAADGVPPAAQEAFERGVVAAEQQQWPLAIRYFREAQKAAPAAPSILFNLGLAHAKAGQELPAIAWLQAYLAAERQATNAEAVRKEIVRLEIATEAKIARILREAASAATAADKARGYGDSEAKSVARAQAFTGDTEGALKAGLKSEEAWSAYASSLAQRGLIEKAEEALRHVSEEEHRDGVYADMVRALTFVTPWPTTRRGFDLARAAALRIQNPGTRATALVEILTVDFRAGDVPLAEKTFVELRTPGLLAPMEGVGRVLIVMIEGAVAAKNFDAAREFAERLLKLGARGMPNHTPYQVVDAVTSIPAAQMAGADTSGARTTATRLLPLANEPLRAALEAVLGNDEPARALAKTLSCAKHDWEQPPRLFNWIISVHVLLEDVPGARAMMGPAAALCPKKDDAYYYKIRLADFLLDGGALRGAVSAARATGGAASEYKLTAFIRRATTVGDLVAVEQAIPDLIKWDFDQMTVRLALADAYEARQAAAEAARLRVEAARFLLAKTEVARLSPSDAFPKMARAVEASGDSNSARAVSALAALARPSSEVEGWSEAALSLASADDIVDPAEAVKRAGELKPSDAISKLEELASKLAAHLFALRARALRLEP